MEILRNNENKAKDFIYFYTTGVSTLTAKNDYKGQTGESKQRREEGKDKIDKEEKINQIWELSKHMSQKLKEELEIAS